MWLPRVSQSWGPRWYPLPEHQAGFVCYAIVYNALIDAEFNYWGSGTPSNCDAILFPLQQVVNTDSAKIGDIVAYYWLGPSDPTCEHIGVITQINGSDIKNDWHIISSIGTKEIFEWGAKPTRLGVFGKTPSGDFTIWDPDWDNWSYKIYHAPQP